MDAGTSPVSFVVVENDGTLYIRLLFCFTLSCGCLHTD